MCIDYRALNKQTHMDHFPLPFINIILGKVVGYEVYTFMDGYFGYNQILIALEDYHKTTFITLWGRFIYIIMSFGPCNVPFTFHF